MSNKIKIVLTCFIILIVFMGVFPVGAVSVGEVSDPVNFVGADDIDGGVKLTKTVSAIDSREGIYNVNFDITNKVAIKTTEKTNPLYVVVVFDTSGSMCDEKKDDCGAKWSNATSGAISFSQELLKNVKDANIALVNFSSDATTTREFKNSELSLSDFDKPDGGTNITKGLSLAKDLLDDIKDENAKKFIILMSDGDPQVYTSVITDYLARYETSNMAKEITSSLIEFFVVGYDVSDSNSEFLESLVKDPTTKYYTEGKIEDIETKFNNIMTEISKFPAGKDVIISDTIGKNFSYIPNSATDGVTVEGNVVTYSIKELTEDGISFNFNIKIDKNSSTGWHDTNDSTSISYIDSLGEEVNKNIEKSSKVYWASPKYEYIINYYKDEVSKNNLIDTVKGTEEFNKEITIDTKYKLPEGYSHSGENLILTINESNNELNVVYTRKENLTYCVNYFYDGIIDINNTECFREQPYGKEITSFIDKPKEDYVFDSFDPIIILDNIDNVLNVYYKKVASGEIVPPKTNISPNVLIGMISLSGLLVLGIILLRKCING